MKKPSWKTGLRLGGLVLGVLALVVALTPLVLVIIWMLLFRASLLISILGLG
jgi:hypothetical protein